MYDLALIQKLHSLNNDPFNHFVIIQLFKQGTEASIQWPLWSHDSGRDESDAAGKGD